MKSSTAFAPAINISAPLTRLLPFILTALAPITPAATPTPSAATCTTFNHKINVHKQVYNR